MKAAAGSCRVSTSLIFEWRSDSRTSRFSSPGSAKMRSTPSFSSAATNRSEPLAIVPLPVHVAGNAAGAHPSIMRREPGDRNRKRLNGDCDRNEQDCPLVPYTRCSRTTDPGCGTEGVPVPLKRAGKKPLGRAPGKKHFTEKQLH